jgi:hypothetical protein
MIKAVVALVMTAFLLGTPGTAPSGHATDVSARPQGPFKGKPTAAFAQDMKTINFTVSGSKVMKILVNKMVFTCEDGSTLRSGYLLVGNAKLNKSTRVFKQTSANASAGTTRTVRGKFSKNEKKAFGYAELTTTMDAPKGLCTTARVKWTAKRR